MPLSAFGRVKSWFGDDEQDDPTPLFPATAEKQSLFPVQSDSSPVLSGLKSGWKGLGDWLNAPAGSDAGKGDDLLAYQPTNRWGAISDALGGAAKGVLGARGEHSNWFGQGLLGASEGMKGTRAHDLELRKMAQEAQYKQAEVALKAVQARNEGLKAGQPTLTSADGSVFQTDPYTHETKLAATAPARPMSADEKARLANEDRRIELEGRRADQTEAYQRAQLAQGAAGQAEAAGYHKTEADLARQRLDVERQNAGTPKTEDERRDKRMLDYSAAVAAGKTPTPEQVAQHERDYRETAQPTSTFDPASGTTIVKQPDVTDIPPPPSMAGKPPPAPGVTQVPQAFPREVVQKTDEKYAAYKTLNETADSIEKKLAPLTPGERWSSDKAAEINMAVTGLIQSLAVAGQSGIVSPTEADNYKAQLGELTGGIAAGKQVLGLDRVKATLKGARDLLRRSVRGTAPVVGSEEQAKALSLGTPFIAPNGRLATRSAEGDYTFLDGGPD